LLKTGQSRKQTKLLVSGPAGPLSDPHSREKDESNAVKSYIESGTSLRNPFSEAGSQNTKIAVLMGCCVMCVYVCLSSFRSGLSEEKESKVKTFWQVLTF